MKRSRKTMLLCVTATSIGAIAACAASHPVGMVARPPEATPDAAQQEPHASDAGASTGANASENDEITGPTVGTTAHVPDKQR